MKRSKILWTPYPYRAGFTITDDTDAATYDQVKTVYDYLVSKNIRITKTVWAYPPNESCGIPAIPDSALRGVTLDDERYLFYCSELSQKGYEICLHGASAGNNIRVKTIQAFELIKRKIGESATYICHSKNADNIYWEDKVTSIFPFKQLLRIYSKNECSGEIKGSPYFWGDICSMEVDQIRLMRTRNINTLKINPSMPYFDTSKPYVNGWFSATKRSLKDCCSVNCLSQLKKDNGLTVLYQYLHRYADINANKLEPCFKKSIDCLSEDKELYVAPVNEIMNRLRLIQGVFIFYNKDNFWIINTNTQDVHDFQVESQYSEKISQNNPDVINNSGILRFPVLGAGSVLCFKSHREIVFQGKNTHNIRQKKYICIKAGLCKLYFNTSAIPWNLDHGHTVYSGCFWLTGKLSGRGKPILSVVTPIENIRLLLHQIYIIIVEIVFKKRNVNIKNYLDTNKDIYLENQNNW